MVPSLVFFAIIVALVRESEEDGGWLWLLALMGLIGALASVVVQTVLAAILPYSAAVADPRLAKVLSDLLGLGLVVYFFPMVAFFVAVGWVATTRPGLPSWLGVFAFVVAAASQVATVGLFVDSSLLAPGGPLSLGAFSLQVLWWLAASLVLVLPSRAIRS